MRVGSMTPLTAAYLVLSVWIVRIADCELSGVQGHGGSLLLIPVHGPRYVVRVRAYRYHRAVAPQSRLFSGQLSD